MTIRNELKNKSHGKKTFNSYFNSTSFFCIEG